jgi:glycosyltransferase involved in cell wall biosynthesis
LTDIIHKQDYDFIFIAREAFMTGTTFFERSFKKSRAKILYDFDDAIWIDVISKKNKSFAWLKNAGKTKKIIGLADMVIAGNDYLAHYARQFNSTVIILPTTIDINLYQPNYRLHAGPIVIGWSGSRTTIEHFKTAIPALIILKKKYAERISFRVIGDGDYRHEELGIIGLPWKRESELEDLWPIDIGIMPLPDNEWAKGKCGLKGLQYMALEIPTIMSPVGVNTEILQNGVNGFLASTTEQWVEKISLLIEDDKLRLLLGKEGRQTVERSFSVESQKQNYLALFK